MDKRIFAQAWKERNLLKVVRFHLCMFVILALGLLLIIVVSSAVYDIRQHTKSNIVAKDKK